MTTTLNKCSENTKLNSTQQYKIIERTPEKGKWKQTNGIIGKKLMH
jgi:hypothetical protein